MTDSKQTRNREHVARYDRSEHGKQTRKAWLQSEAGKASAKARIERAWRKKLGVDALLARIAQLEAQLDSGWALCNDHGLGDWQKAWTFAKTKRGAPTNKPAVYLDATNGRFYAIDNGDRQCGSYETLAEAQKVAIAGYDAWKRSLRGEA